MRQHRFGVGGRRTSTSTSSAKRYGFAPRMPPKWRRNRDISARTVTVRPASPNRSSDSSDAERPSGRLASTYSISAWRGLSRCVHVPEAPATVSSGSRGERTSRTTRVGGAVSCSVSRISQPPGTGSAAQLPYAGSQTRPGARPVGSAIRSTGATPAAAATQPCSSATTACPLTFASTGTAKPRSRSSSVRWAVRSWDSASRVTASTSANVVAWTVGAGPERSTTPSSLPSRGSCSGAAAHVQECCART